MQNLRPIYGKKYSRRGIVLNRRRRWVKGLKIKFDRVVMEINQFDFIKTLGGIHESDQEFLAG